jgi:hypothetical protein
VSFTRARVEKPELFSFDTLRLRPSWLVGVDARKFDFTAVEWYGMPNGPEGGLNDEISRVHQKEQARSPHVLLEQACQKLAANAEENRQYSVANEFYYWSMDAARMRNWVSSKTKAGETCCSGNIGQLPRRTFNRTTRCTVWFRVVITA